MKARRSGPTRHRKDGNLDIIAEEFERAGFLVHRLNSELCDLVVQLHGTIDLIEVKPNAKASYTDGQLELLGQGWKIHRVDCVDDVIARRSVIVKRNG